MTGRPYRAARKQELRGRLPVVTGIAALGVVLVDSLRLVGVQGEVTIAILGITGLICLNAILPPRRSAASIYEPRPRGSRMPPKWLTLFMFWVGFSTLLHPVTPEGYQNLVVYGIFFLSIPAAGAATTAASPIRVVRAFRAAGIVAALVYLSTVAVFGLENSVLYGARALAGSLLTALAVAIAARSVLRSSRWPIALMVLSLATSLSRAALAIAAILLVTLALRGKPMTSFVKVGILGGAILTAFVVAYQNFAPFRARFEEGDGYAVGGFTVGSSGRAALWDATIAHWQESPWIGHGVGSSETYTFRVFQSIGHPHSDYLRFLHDFGIIGLALWVFAFLALIRGAFRRYRLSAGADQAIHLAAMLLLAKLALFMVANNPIVGVFGMLATGAVVGVSIARGSEPPGREVVDAGRGVVDLEPDLR